METLLVLWHVQSISFSSLSSGDQAESRGTWRKKLNGIALKTVIFVVQICPNDLFCFIWLL